MILATTSADLLLIDLDSPKEADPTQATTLRQTYPNLPLLILTSVLDYSLLHSLVNLGVTGILSKESADRAFFATLHAAVAGNQVFSPTVLKCLLTQQADETTLVELTPQERTLFTLMLQGKKHPTIAKELNISPQTARNYASQIYAKLGVYNRAELLAKFCR